MAKPQPLQQLALLEIVLRRHPNGATLTDIARELAPAPENRTLERWLKMLVDQRRAMRIDSADVPLFVSIAPAEPEAATAAAGVETTATAVETAPASPEARFAELYEAAVVQIIVGSMPLATTISALQLQAARERLPLEQRLAYVAYVKARLAALKREDAERMGILPETFDAWQQRWATVAPAATPATQPRAQAIPETAAPSPTPIRATENVPDDPVVQLVQPETAQAPAAPLSPTATAPAAPPADDLTEVLKGLGLASLVPAFATTIALAKELFTWKRAVIAVGWGVLVMYVVQRQLPVIPNLYILQIPILGLPWYVFLRLVRRGRKPAVREIVAALAGGGGATMFVAGIAYPIVVALISRR